MNHETELKLQAYLDQELSPGESEKVARWLEHDSEARAVYRELRATKELLGIGEVKRAVPESREFYWSKIERGILAEDREPSTGARSHFWCGWLRLGAPLAGAALLVAALLIALNFDGVGTRIATSYFHEVEAPVEEATAITFHSETAQMTVVWIPSRAK